MRDSDSLITVLELRSRMSSWSKESRNAMPSMCSKPSLSKKLATSKLLKPVIRAPVSMRALYLPAFEPCATCLSKEATFQSLFKTSMVTRSGSVSMCKISPSQPSSNWHPFGHMPYGSKSLGVPEKPRTVSNRTPPPMSSPEAESFLSWKVISFGKVVFRYSAIKLGEFLRRSWAPATCFALSSWSWCRGSVFFWPESTSSSHISSPGVFTSPPPSLTQRLYCSIVGRSLMGPLSPSRRFCASRKASFTSFSRRPW
mmetsp:Transcript_23140/g.74780  ORF Transcript_23140/g.74780 Transcript_23140/m.74780 type:complete len:256 (-) Transcript_23140:1320-2087(-)